MNWRRGLLLAGIHLVVAGTLIVWFEARDAQYVKDRIEAAAEATRNPEGEKKRVEELTEAIRETAASEHTTFDESSHESVTIDIDPCKMWVHYPAETRVMVYLNLPAIMLTGWRDVCPPRWSLAGMLHPGGWGTITASSIAAQRQVDWGLGAIVAIQWLLVGGFPLVRSKRPWGEPGFVITVCAVLAFGLVIIPAAREAALVPAFFALLAWLWWFGLLVWTGLRSGWRLIRRTKPQAV